MKTGKIFWGLALVILAVLLILDAVGVMAPITGGLGDITFWQVFGGACVLYAAIHLIVSRQVWMSIIFFGFLFMIFERNIAFVCGLGSANIINNWLLFGCTLLLSIGLSMIFPTRKRGKVKHRKRGKLTFTANENNMSHADVYIDCASFTEEFVENNLGATEVHFDNADEYVGGGVLHIENNLGATEIYVPRAWKIESDISNSLGSVEIEHDGKRPEGAPIIKIVGSNSLGAIEISRI